MEEVSYQKLGAWKKGIRELCLEAGGGGPRSWLLKSLRRGDLQLKSESLWERHRMEDAQTAKGTQSRR